MDNVLRDKLVQQMLDIESTLGGRSSGRGPLPVGAVEAYQTAAHVAEFVKAVADAAGDEALGKVADRLESKAEEYFGASVSSTEMPTLPL